MIENTPAVNAAVVALFVDLDMTKGGPNTWTHMDGRPVTRAEMELAMSATRADLIAVREYSLRRLDHAREQENAFARIVEIISPYAAAGENTPLHEIRRHLNDDERAELDRLSELVAPDGFLVR